MIRGTNLMAERCPEVPPFRIVSVFDSWSASQEASRASEILLRELGEDVAVNKSTWNIRLLESDALRERAADEASRADVIVLALKEDHAPTVKQWVGHWRGQRESGGGLITYIPCGGRNPELSEYLRETAISTGMDFLCRDDEVRRG